MKRRTIVPLSVNGIAGFASVLLGYIAGVPAWGWTMLGFFGLLAIAQIVGARRQASND